MAAVNVHLRRESFSPNIYVNWCNFLFCKLHDMSPFFLLWPSAPEWNRSLCIRGNSGLSLTWHWGRTWAWTSLWLARIAYWDGKSDGVDLVLLLKSLTHLILDLFTFTRSYQMPQQAHIYTIGTEGTVLHISLQSSWNQPNQRFLPVTGFSLQLRTMTLDVAAPASLAQVGQDSQQ